VFSTAAGAGLLRRIDDRARRRGKADWSSTSVGTPAVARGANGAVNSFNLGRPALGPWPPGR